MVATPIGNLEDVTLRALRVLSEAELLLAEDTRHVRKLLERHAIEQRPVSFHAHNEASRVDQALAVLARGGDVALVSDAGTPLVSDPGERLVRAALEKGFPVAAVPGPSAVLAALSVAGLAADRFTFVGFPPRKAGERRQLFARLAAAPETLVFFESPRRLAKTLAELAEALGPRRACVARELTKLHEEAVRMPLPELALRFADGARGEVTLVVEGARGGEPTPAPEELDEEIRARIARGESSREIAAALAGKGMPRRAVYARAVALRDAASGS